MNILEITVQYINGAITDFAQAVILTGVNKAQVQYKSLYLKEIGAKLNQKHYTAKTFQIALLLQLILISCLYAAPGSFYDAQKWFSNPVAGISRAEIEPGQIVIEQKGAIAHKNKWVISNIGFDIKFEHGTSIGNQYAFLMQFAKLKRNTSFGEAHNRGTKGYSYALAISADGKVSIAKIGLDNKIEIIHESAKIDLHKQNFIGLKMDYKDGFEFRLKVNNSVSTAVDKPKGKEYSPAGYITFINTAICSKVTLSDIKLNAKEIEVDENVEVHDVYFLEYFDHDANKFIHWKYNERTQDYAGANIYCNGKLIESIDYPCDRYFLSDAISSDELTVKAVNIDGKEAAGVGVKLVSDEKDLIEKNLQRILVKRSNPIAKLVKENTGELFEVRGANYVRLCFGDHSTFIAKTDYLPNSYDPYDVEAMFRLLKRNGYNSVRVFLNGRGVINPGIGGYPAFNEPVYKPYIDNLIDLLTKAKKYGIYVLPTFGDGELPLNEYYKPFIRKMIEITDEPGQIGSGIPFNSVYLTSPGIEARQILIRETLNYIKQKDPTLLKAILTVQCQNELSLNSAQWPFKLTKGKVTTANGKTYDMADANSRQLCMDEGLNHYHQKMIETIKGVDPELLVAEGTFTLRIVGKDPEKNKGLYPKGNSDTRFPATAVVLGESKLDIIDIHIYHVSKEETPKLSYRKDMESMKFYSPEMDQIRKQTPVIMGEFGAFTFMNDSIETARQNILETRDACLEDDLNGFMIWTLDTFEQQELYNALDIGPNFLKELNDKHNQ